jgi:hypothetical protein
MGIPLPAGLVVGVVVASGPPSSAAVRWLVYRREGEIRASGLSSFLYIVSCITRPRA